MDVCPFPWQLHLLNTHNVHQVKTTNSGQHHHYKMLGGLFVPLGDLLQEMDLVHPSIIRLCRCGGSFDPCVLAAERSSCSWSQKRGIPVNRSWLAALAGSAAAVAKVIFTLAVFIVLLFNHTVTGFMSFLSMQTIKRNVGSDINEWSGEKNKQRTEMCYVMLN